MKAGEFARMRNFKEIVHRTNMQKICSFVLNGIDPSRWDEELDIESYETRVENGEAPLWEFLENLYPDGKERDAAYELICTALITNQEVYTELGMKLGANMILELLKSNPLA